MTLWTFCGSIPELSLIMGFHMVRGKFFRVRRAGKASVGSLFCVLGLPAMLLICGCSSGRNPGAYAQPAGAPLSDNDSGFFDRRRPVNPPAEFDVDKNAAAAIRQELRRDTALADASGDVQVKVRKGVVTLTGSIPSAEQKKRIVQKVEAVPGVDRVVDHLKVASR